MITRCEIPSDARPSNELLYLSTRQTPIFHHARSQSDKQATSIRTSRSAPIPHGVHHLRPPVSRTSSRFRLPLRGSCLTSVSLSRSILITFSSPFITTIYFLRAGVVNFGAFGYNSPGFRSDDVLGYEYGLQVLNPLTNAMILWGIGELRILLDDLRRHSLTSYYCRTLLHSAATAFAFFALISIIPLLWVHDSAALHAVANNTFFTYSSVSFSVKVISSPS